MGLRRPGRGKVGGGGSGELPCRAGSLREQPQEGGSALGKGGKLGHVADSLGEGDGGSPPAKQDRKPLGGLKARLVVVEGEEDPGAAPKGRGDPLDALGAQGSDGGDAPRGKGKPVEDALGDDRPRRSGAETPKPKHRLGAGKCLEAGSPVGIDGPAHKPADKPARDLWNDHHPGEPLRTPPGKQPAVPEPTGTKTSRLKGLPKPVPRREAEAEPQGGVRADAPRGKVVKPGGTAPELTGVEPRRRRQERRVPRRGRAALGVRRAGAGWETVG